MRVRRVTSCNTVIKVVPKLAGVMVGFTYKRVIGGLLLVS